MYYFESFDVELKDRRQKDISCFVKNNTVGKRLKQKYFTIKETENNRLTS